MKMVDLPNTAGALECIFAYSGAAAISVVRKGKAATDAGDNGAITLWYDDAHALRGSRCVHFMQVEVKTFKTQTQAAK